MSIPVNGDYLLMVDDNALDIELNLMALRKINFGVPVITARDGDEAVQLIRMAHAAGNLPRLLMLDLKMPRMDGYEVLEVLISENLKRFPIVVFSGSGLPEDRMRVMHLGADALHEKPFDYYANIRLFRKILTSWAKDLVTDLVLDYEEEGIY
jgi:two-component system, response regulator